MMEEFMGGGHPNNHLRSRTSRVAVASAPRRKKRRRKKKSKGNSGNLVGQDETVPLAPGKISVQISSVFVSASVPYAYI